MSCDLASKRQSNNLLLNQRFLFGPRMSVVFEGQNDFIHI